MKNKYSIFALLMVTVLFFSACQPSVDVVNDEWQRIKDSANGSTVRLYTWSEDDQLIDYFQKNVATELAEKYNITLKIQQGSRKELLAKLAAEKTNQEDVGSIDLIWMDEKDYSVFKNTDFLYTGFATEIKNYNQYFSGKELNVKYCNGLETESDIFPVNRQLLSFYYNQDVIYDPPLDLESLKKHLIANPESFTYPKPSDTVGRAFLHSVILNYAKSEDFIGHDLSEEQVIALIQPGIDYLKEIKPYLYKEGKSFPQTIEELSDLYATQKLHFMFDLDYRKAANMVSDNSYPLSTRAFVLGNSSVGSSQYLAVPFNAKNKAGAMLAINYLLSMEAQIDKIKSKSYYGLPSYDYASLSKTEQKKLAKAIRKKTIVKIPELISIAKIDIPEQYHQIIADYWQSEMSK